MTRVVVLGGTGYLGARTVEALRAARLDVAVASRRGPVQVDSSRTSSFEALAPFDVVVDLSDTVTSPPDLLVAWCLANGKTVVEATSDAPCVERLAVAHRATAGRLVLGGGIFTGVSNLLARAVADAAGGAEAVTLGIASSPFSGAGRGTVALMVGALAVPAVRYVGGVRREVPGLTRGPTLDFGGHARPTVRMSLAEPSMVHASTGARDVDVFFAPVPGFLAASFTALPAWLVRQGWYAALMRGYFSLLRRVVLRGRATTVELTVTARGAGGAARGFVRARDGMRAGAAALAAMVEAVVHAEAWRGLRYIDDVCALEPITRRANELAGESLFDVTVPALVDASPGAVTVA
jgi:short subunit dehydrogenase-like uncharacterized protein